MVGSVSESVNSPCASLQINGSTQLAPAEILRLLLGCHRRPYLIEFRFNPVDDDVIGYLEIGEIIHDTVAQRIGFRGIDKLCGRTPISRIGYIEFLNIGSHIYRTGISTHTVEIGSTDRNFFGRQTTIDKA